MHTKTLLGVEQRKLVSGGEKTRELIQAKKSPRIDPAPEIPLIDQTFPLEIYWTNVLLCVGVHAVALYGLYLGLTVVMWKTWLWSKSIFHPQLFPAHAYNYYFHLSKSLTVPHASSASSYLMKCNFRILHNGFIFFQ